MKALYGLILALVTTISFSASANYQNPRPGTEILEAMVKDALDHPANLTAELLSAALKKATQLTGTGFQKLEVERLATSGHYNFYIQTHAVNNEMVEFRGELMINLENKAYVFNYTAERIV